MPNPPKPIEQKRMLGNPGKRALPDESKTIALPVGKIDPIRPLKQPGLQLWDSVFAYGELWVSNRTDIHLLQMTCEQLDRREDLREYVTEHPDEWHMFKQINDLERLISSNLGLLGFTPADRVRLGLAEAKKQSKLEELLAKRNKS